MEKSPEAFRTISEVSEVLATPAHVLRFWESRFTQIRPIKRAGGRRYYRPSDVALLSGIRRLLHDEGLTIRGVQKILREQGIRHVAGLGEGEAGIGAGETSTSDAYDLLAGSPEDEVGGRVEDPSENAIEKIVDFMAKVRKPAPPRSADRPAPPSEPSLFDRLEAADDDAPDPALADEVAEEERAHSDVTAPAAGQAHAADAFVDEPNMDAPVEPEHPHEIEYLWLPTLLRSLPKGALDNRQARLLPLFGRLSALRDTMAQTGTQTGVSSGRVRRD
jgi:DNA-binding transcriptional MerR regulator